MVVLAPPQDSSVNSFIPLLKQYYLNIRPENNTYKQRPLFAIVPKMVTFEGINAPLPLMYSNPQGVSAQFSVAMSSQSPTQSAAFQLTRAPKYGFATLQGEAYLAARSSAGSFVSSFSTVIDNTFLEMTQDIHADLYGDGSGIRSAVASVSGNVITLANVVDVRKFSVSMSIDIAQSVNVSAGVTFITAIDRNLGTITVNSVPAAVSPDANINGYGIYRNGSRGSQLNLSGLAGWLPAGGPTSTPWFGVDRTQDTQRLGGVFVNAVGGSVFDALQTMAAQISINGGTPDYVLLHPLKYLELIKTLDSQVLYHNVDLEGLANVSFRSVILQTDFGMVRCVPDSMATPLLSGPYAGRYPLYMLQMDTWYLMSLDQAPHVIQDDGLYVIRAASEDALQVRLRFLGNLGNRSPGYSGVAVV